MRRPSVRTGALRRLLASLLLACIAPACESPRPFDRAAGDEAPGYIDELPEATRSAVAGAIGEGLLRGTGTYRLQPGDRIDVTYHFESRQLRAYRLAIGDELDLDFAFDRSLNRALVVRPDGMISLPGEGEIRALGETPAALSRAISARYAAAAVEPRVTVIVRRFATPIDDLADVVRLGAENRTRSALVRPDGLVDLPLLQGVQAAGETVQELQARLNQRYARHGGGISTSVRVTAIAANQIFVFGEVKQAGAVPAPSPRTLLQTVAAAGGPLPTGAIDQIRVVYFDPVGRPRIRQVDLRRILQDGRIEEDMIVPPNSTIYVPPTQIARVGRFVDQVIRQIFLFNGVSIGLSYYAALPGALSSSSTR